MVARAAVGSPCKLQEPSASHMDRLEDPRLKETKYQPELVIPQQAREVGALLVSFSLP